MTGQPLIAIMMRTYNGKPYIRAQIDSILAQTYQNWSLLYVMAALKWF